MAEPFDDPFDDQPLVRSLRAPGTPGELADQDHYLAMFREVRDGRTDTSHPTGSRRRPGGRAVRRLGAGATLSIAIAVAGGGVAAAYTASLPEPLQQFAHEVLGPVNVPPPTGPRPDPVAAVPDPDPSQSGQESPSATPSAPAPTPAAEASRLAGEDLAPTGAASLTDEPSMSPSDDPTPTASGSPTASPTPTPTPTATPTPTPTPTPTSTSTATPDAPRPASVTISGTTHRVDYAASLVFSGVVTDDEETGLADVKVALMQLQDGAWHRVAVATSDEDGAVSVSAPPIYENTSMRLRTAGAKSERWRVRVHPELTMAPTVDGNTVTIVAAATGGQAGDVVSLTGRRDGERVTLATGILGADGTVTFQVQQETRRSRYTGRLEPTEQHTADKVVIVVVKPKPPSDGDPETPPARH